MAGAFLVYLCYKPHYDETIDSRNILLTFATVPEIERKSWNFITEMVASFVLVFSVFALGGIALLTSKQVLNDPSFESVVSAVVNNRFLISFVVGIVVFGIGLSLGGPTGYAINPARDLGPRIVHSLLPISQKGSSRWSYAWIPIVAPITGGILAAGLFRLLFLLATNFQL